MFRLGCKVGTRQEDQKGGRQVAAKEAFIDGERQCDVTFPECDIFTLRMSEFLVSYCSSALVVSYNPWK